MDQLEVELESELQKLPWFTTEASGPERSSDFFETEFSDEELNKLDGQNLESYQHNHLNWIRNYAMCSLKSRTA